MNDRLQRATGGRMLTFKRARWALWLARVAGLCVLVIVPVALAIWLAQPAHASDSQVKIERVVDMLNEQQGWWSHDYPKGPRPDAKWYDLDWCVRAARAPARGEWSPTTAS